MSLLDRLNLLDRLQDQLTMSMFRNVWDLAAEALKQRAEAAELIRQLLSERGDLLTPLSGVPLDTNGNSGKNK